MNSPPKRMTRARAAAKVAAPADRVPGAATAATASTTARSRSSTATAGTQSTAAKRKTRTDDDEIVKEAEPPRKTARGRPKSTAESQDLAPIKKTTTSAPATTAASRIGMAALIPRSTRVRPTRKPPVPTTSKSEAVPAVKTTAATARGRPKKLPTDSKPEAPTNTTTTSTAASKAPRARSSTTSSRPETTTSKLNKPAVKKVVKFQEPDKENFEPGAKKEPAAPGLRGRPTRRGVGITTATTNTKSFGKKAEAGEKKPLSPKKVTQLSLPRDDESEDELAGDVPVSTKPLQKSPVKPPSMKKQAELVISEEDMDVPFHVNTATLDPHDLAVVVNSPAKRLPPPAAKDTMMSPARKIGPVLFPGSAFKTTGRPPSADGPASPTRNNLLQSAAKRPASPIKGLQLGSMHKQPESTTKVSIKSSLLFSSPAKRAMPGLKSLAEARQISDLSTPSAARLHENSASTSTRSTRSTRTLGDSRRPSEKALMDDEMSDASDNEELIMKPIANLQFPGRLSATSRRQNDVNDDIVFSDEEKQELQFYSREEEEKVQDGKSEADMPESDEDKDELVDDVRANIQDVETELDTESGSVIDGLDVESADIMEDVQDAVSEALEAEMDAGDGELVDAYDVSTEEESPQPANPLYQLRDEDLDPCQDSDEDEDMTIAAQATPTTSSFTMERQSRRSTLGFTALAEKLDAWSASTPAKGAPGQHQDMSDTDDNEATPKAMSSRNSGVHGEFLNDGVYSPRSRSLIEGCETPVSYEREVENVAFDDVMMVDEDLDLAQEADGMSLKESDQHEATDDTLSDASQEYGDENDVPIDPAIMAPVSVPVTPVRKPKKVFFYTTTKVPLKPADDSTPSPMKKRSFSASRPAPTRPSNLRNISTISYSPKTSSRRESTGTSSPRTPTPKTPTAKNDMWSAMGTPARTPHRNLNPALLSGAVVFVDVYTSEGADASGIFVELLSQMGARCIKRWDYNPSSSSNDESSSSKIGITHVVFKDGSKRTLEKVRETKGVVQCVGVSWVLDCERENEWMDEAAYSINTSNIPRGGARRRKSMEPKALANMNGTLVSSPSKSAGSRESQGAPGTPTNRRQSSAWVYTPSEGNAQEEDDEEELEWSKFTLTPVPKTPAPEAVHKYANELPESPYGSEDSYMMDTPTQQPTGTRTCPPKANPYRDIGLSCPPKANLFSDAAMDMEERSKDETLLMRLMAARRKSLQFAPKIGSPLSKTWK